MRWSAHWFERHDVYQNDVEKNVNCNYWFFIISIITIIFANFFLTIDFSSTWCIYII